MSDERPFAEAWAERVAIARFSGKRVVVTAAVARLVRQFGGCMDGVEIATSESPATVDPDISSAAKVARPRSSDIGHG